MFGSHLSIAGGMHLALLEAQKLDMTCVQVFTKNQRQWSVKPLRDEEVRDWHAHRKSMGLRCVVSHDSYLINLASPDDTAREKSIALFREELSRCEALEIPYLVTHPGAHMGSGDDAGLSRVASALDRLHDELPNYRTITCIEATAGQGTSLGHRFEHLRAILERVKQPERVGVCIDTAHILEAGYDLSSGDGARATLDELQAIVGLDRVKVLHINDSKTPRGSRVDRHEHIGMGNVALDAFAVILRHPLLGALPKILETPKDGTAPDGREWDTVNIEALTRLMDENAPASTTKVAEPKSDNPPSTPKAARAPKKSKTQSEK